MYNQVTHAISIAEIDDVGDEFNPDVDVEHFENPRRNETLVDTFEVTMENAQAELAWDS